MKSGKLQAIIAKIHTPYSDLIALNRDSKKYAELKAAFGNLDDKKIQKEKEKFNKQVTFFNQQLREVSNESKIGSGPAKIFDRRESALKELERERRKYFNPERMRIEKNIADSNKLFNARYLLNGHIMKMFMASTSAAIPPLIIPSVTIFKGVAMWPPEFAAITISSAFGAYIAVSTFMQSRMGKNK